MLPIIFGLIIFFFLAVFFILIFRYLDVRTNQEYRDLYRDEYYQRESGDCPEGCLNGVCQSKYCVHHRPPHPKCCAFDFQCKYCTTRDGDPFAQVYEEIKRDYQRHQTRDEIQRLNDRIFKENLYIAKLNRYIKGEGESA